MVWFETPSNPLLKIADIAEIAEAAHEYNPEILVVVDNTFMTPYFQVSPAIFLHFRFKKMVPWLKFSKISCPIFVDVCSVMEKFFHGFLT